MYKNIFDEIVRILHYDYAGFQDKKNWDNPEFFRKKISTSLEITDYQFVRLVQDYLLDFRDKHIIFKHK
ncbi:hypothetical protein [Radiobacillus deserti]|uniref:hypothetical protein n=1 Tax=Radiobacillus deserti TaxID=2594883 RepID=UPI001E581177|nr:hypothetical protein [Radiobacillus deserti]